MNIKNEIPERIDKLRKRKRNSKFNQEFLDKLSKINKSRPSRHSLYGLMERKYCITVRG